MGGGTPSRRRFLAGSAALGFLGCVEAVAPALAARAAATVRIDRTGPAFNGQDLRLASYLERDPGVAASLRGAAPLVEALAWALAPSGAAETWRLDELARRGGPALWASDDGEIERDRLEAERRLGEALRATSSTLPPVGLRRFTRYRYLNVCETLRADPGVGLLVPALLPAGAWADRPGAPTSLADQVCAVARIVELCGGRVHPLVPFDPALPGALALVRAAVERQGFLGVTCPARTAGGERGAAAELLAWCEREDVPVVAPGGTLGLDVLSALGLRRGRRTRERLERFYEGRRIPAPGWTRAVDGA